MKQQVRISTGNSAAIAAVCWKHRPYFDKMYDTHNDADISLILFFQLKKKNERTRRGERSYRPVDVSH